MVVQIDHIKVNGFFVDFDWCELGESKLHTDVINPSKF